MSQAIETDAVWGMRLRGREEKLSSPGSCSAAETRPGRVLCCRWSFVYITATLFLGLTCAACVAGEAGGCPGPQVRESARPALQVTHTFALLQLAVSSLTVSLTRWPVPGPASLMPTDWALGIQPLCRRREGWEAARAKRPAGAYHCRFGYRLHFSLHCP